MKLCCAVLVLLVALLHFGHTFTPIDSPVDMLAEESQLSGAQTVPAVHDGTVREKRGLKYQYHYKEKSIGGGLLFPFKQTVEKKVHIKHGHHGLLGGHQYREVTKVKQFGFGR